MSFFKVSKSDMSLDALYRGVEIGELLVIGGIALEETPLLLTFATSLKERFVENRSRTGIVKLIRKIEKILESAGLIILVCGLLIENRYESAARSSEGNARAVSERVILGLQRQVNSDGREIAKALHEATDANNKAAAILAENIELERALNPRTIEQVGIARSVVDLPRVPLFISAVNLEEPQSVAAQIISALGIQIGKSAPWQSSPLLSANWPPEGISIVYLRAIGNVSNDNNDAERVAVALCEELKVQGISAHTTPFPLGFPLRDSEWPSLLPKEAVLISVGTKPNLFWENKMRRKKGMEDLQETAFCTSDEFVDFERKRTRERRVVAPAKKPTQ